MVVFSSHENFVFRLNVEGANSELSWIVRIEAAETLKNKVYICSMCSWNKRASQMTNF
jgi:uncharacterized membrane protein YqhA